MKYYDDTKPLYLKTDASRSGLVAALLQAQKGTTCQKDMVPDNTILHLIAFASKSLTDAECRYSNIERGTGHTTQAQKMSPLLFCKGGVCNY